MKQYISNKMLALSMFIIAGMLLFAAFGAYVARFQVNHQEEEAYQAYCALPGAKCEFPNMVAYLYLGARYLAVTVVNFFGAGIELEMDTFYQLPKTLK